MSMTTEINAAELNLQTQMLSADSQNAEEVSEEDLAIYWTLTAPEIEWIFASVYRNKENLLRFAIQWCALRKTI